MNLMIPIPVMSDGDRDDDDACWCLIRFSFHYLQRRVLLIFLSFGRQKERRRNPSGICILSGVGEPVLPRRTDAQCGTHQDIRVRRSIDSLSLPRKERELLCNSWYIFQYWLARHPVDERDGQQRNMCFLIDELSSHHHRESRFCFFFHFLPTRNESFKKWEWGDSLFLLSRLWADGQ